MNTNTIVAVVVGALIVGGSVYYLMRESTPAVAPGTTATQSQTEQSSATPFGKMSPKFTGSFTDLAARGGSWKCTIEAGTAQSISSGVVYVLDSKVRGDFTTAVQGFGNVESHMLVDGTYVYTWSSMMPQGMKTKMAATATSGTTETSGQSVSANQSYSYDCQPSTPDATLFALPANITFKAY